jgi:hypothetical protein
MDHIWLDGISSASLTMYHEFLLEMISIKIILLDLSTLSKLGWPPTHTLPAWIYHEPIPCLVAGIVPYIPQYSKVEFPSVFAMKVDKSYLVM